MSEYRKAARPEFKVLLAAAGLDVEPVSTDRRLSATQFSEQDTEEVFAHQLGHRLLVTHDESPDIAVQDTLNTHGIPTLEPSDMHIDGLYMWIIPRGSYPLRSALHIIAQNTERYGDLLLQAKTIAEDVEATGLGILSGSEGRGVLDHFVITQTDNGPGVSVVLAPPYMLAGGEEDAVTVHDALLQSDLFTSESLDMLFGGQSSDNEGSNGYY